MGVRVLYVSGSLGLGHVTRDLAVVGEMRRMCPGVDVEWIAGSPASEALADAGERLAPEHVDYRCETDLAERVASDGRLSLTTYVFRALSAWIHNARLIGRAAECGGFDVIVGNETYEIPVANFFGVRVLPPVPFVMMYDFWGMEATSGAILEKLGAWAINLIWSQEWRVTARDGNAAIFFGEPEDVPDERFGFMLPDRRRYAEGHVEFVGYAVPFDVDRLPDRATLRRELAYESTPLVMCTVGGTSIGRELLELCGRAYPIASERLPGLQMILVAGPRIDPGSLVVPEGVEKRGMVRELWRHMAACDLVITQAGGTTTLELETLGVPFLYFPIEHQSEQEITVAGRLARHRAGIRMRLSSTSPESLAEAIGANLGRKVSSAPLSARGARLAARRVLTCAGLSSADEDSASAIDGERRGRGPAGRTDAP